MSKWDDEEKERIRDILLVGLVCKILSIFSPSSNDEYHDLTIGNSSIFSGVDSFLDVVWAVSSVRKCIRGLIQKKIPE